LQEHQPGIGPHQHAGPERQDHADQNQVGPETLQARGGVGNGKPMTIDRIVTRKLILKVRAKVSQ
jgi:hypothetical protein